MNWAVPRRESCLPLSHLQSWDRRANWSWDDPGIADFGCMNNYTKRPRTFVTDFKRQIDVVAAIGIRGLSVWGFLRDSHGGVTYAKELCDYAAERGVLMHPGVGTNLYGGVYYEGNHVYNLETFLKKYPEARAIWDNNVVNGYSACPTHPAFVEWITEGLAWLFKEFRIGGVIFENGDAVVCHCPRCSAMRNEVGGQGREVARMRLYAYGTCAKAIDSVRAGSGVLLNSYATYCGFMPPPQGKWDYMGDHDKLSTDDTSLYLYGGDTHYVQWTLTKMLLKKPVPLLRFLEIGAPEEFYDNPSWSRGLRPPVPRSVGYFHQGAVSNFWGSARRYSIVIGSIKEACLRGAEAGLSGLSMCGETSSFHVPTALNYLAFSHFTSRPRDTLLDFARDTLGAVMESPSEAELYVRALAEADGGSVSPALAAEVHRRASADYEPLVRYRRVVVDPELKRFWMWLDGYVRGETEKYCFVAF